MSQRITLLAAATGLLVVLLGIVPTATQRLGANATNTSAYNAAGRVIESGAELLPLALLLLAVGAILQATGILGVLR